MAIKKYTKKSEGTSKLTDWGIERPIPLQHDKKHQMTNIQQILTERQEFIDELKECETALVELISELRHQMNKIYNLDELVATARHLEDRLMELESDFIKNYKTELIIDSSSEK